MKCALFFSMNYRALGSQFTAFTLEASKKNLFPRHRTTICRWPLVFRKDTWPPCFEHESIYGFLKSSSPFTY